MEAPKDILVEFRTPNKAPQDQAVIIGIEDYTFMPDVPFAARDAEAFQKFVTATQGVPIGNVQYMVQTNAQQPITAEKVKELVGKAARAAGKDGTVWVYFAGHGAAHPEDRERLLIAGDAAADEGSLKSRSVKVKDLEDLIGQSAAKQGVIVTDACFGGAGRNGDALLPDKRWVVPASAKATVNKVSVWAAASANELSGPFDAAKHGLFTYFVVGALRGWADGALGEADGKVSMAEAQAYVAGAMRAVGTGNQSPSQDERSDVQAWTLTRANETGPDLNQLALNKGTQAIVNTVTGAKSIEQLKLERLERLRVEQENIERERKIREARDAKADVEKGKLREKASKEWKDVQELASDGSPEGKEALSTFIQTWEEAQVMVEGSSYRLNLAEVEQAYDLMERYEKGIVRKSASSGNPVQDIRNAGEGGTGDWDARVQGILVGAFDSNRSGSIDNSAELSAVNCDVWTAMDDAVVGSYGTPMYYTYGFAGGVYMGEGLGLATSVQGAAAEALEGCGLADHGNSAVQSLEAMPEPYNAGSGAIESYVGQLPNVGTGEWASYIGMALVSKYDANRTGNLESPPEIRNISCEVWRAIDTRLKDQGASTAEAFGFTGEGQWHGGAIGIDVNMKSETQVAVQKCIGA